VVVTQLISGLAFFFASASVSYSRILDNKSDTTLLCWQCITALTMLLPTVVPDLDGYDGMPLGYVCLLSIIHRLDTVETQAAFY
jgi:drug/metabolite transporter (DMT)-like permease